MTQQDFLALIGELSNAVSTDSFLTPWQIDCIKNATLLKQTLYYYLDNNTNNTPPKSISKDELLKKLMRLSVNGLPFGDLCKSEYFCVLYEDGNKRSVYLIDRHDTVIARLKDLDINLYYKKSTNQFEPYEDGFLLEVPKK